MFRLKDNMQRDGINHIASTTSSVTMSSERESLFDCNIVTTSNLSGKIVNLCLSSSEAAQELESRRKIPGEAIDDQTHFMLFTLALTQSKPHVISCQLTVS